ncbi:hypothetical protein GCM10010251_75230 [Streptomyces aurantiogriseus]|uniref:Uncharacterized protein n=1 Tax=Streptomyces aurantiogriseus TaxID=66870 RepID=A0A918KYB8_9ACTN|nr:hypothetical protein GCM10010251_75230 [Streptomyces aurantiogriseus]
MKAKRYRAPQVSCDPSRVDPAFEASLRVEPPAQGFFRLTTYNQLYLALPDEV